MKITEIEKGANVLIQITINKNKLEFASKVMARDDKFVFIDVIRNNGNVMGISGEGVAVDIMLIRPDKSPIVWKNVYTELVSIKEGTVYKIGERLLGSLSESLVWLRWEQTGRR